jgi:hypothetical protein
MYPAVGRPGIDVLPTRRLCRTEVAPYESLEHGVPSVCHNAAVQRMRQALWFRIASTPAIVNNGSNRNQCVFTDSRMHEYRIRHWPQPRILRSCAFYADPTTEEPDLSHWKSRNGHPPSLRHLLYLLYGQSTHPRALVKNPAIGGPCKSLSRWHHGRGKSTHQTFKNVSSEALIRMLPEAVSAQQQLLTSS